MFNPDMPASVAQLDTCQVGDQEVEGLIQVRLGSILSWKLIIFSIDNLSFPLIQEGQLSVCTSTG